jgi:sphingolipid delta-4 desaturase
LYGIEPSTIPITLLAVGIQLLLGYAFGTLYPQYFYSLGLLTAYVIGGSLTQVFGVVIHELCHCLASESPLVNRLMGLVANICIPFPIAASFRRYHLDHHAFQGVEGKDPDLPLKWEIYFVKGNMIMKTLFLFCYPLMYVVRGAALKKIPSEWEIINVLFTLVSDFLIYHFLGPKALAYLFFSLWFGYGLHPAAMHFIQEHYTYKDGQETYSYYGSWNTMISPKSLGLAYLMLKKWPPNSMSPWPLTTHGSRSSFPLFGTLN